MKLRWLVLLLALPVGVLAQRYTREERYPIGPGGSYAYRPTSALVTSSAEVIFTGTIEPWEGGALSIRTQSNNSWNQAQIHLLTQGTLSLPPTFRIGLADVTSLAASGNSIAVALDGEFLNEPQPFYFYHAVLILQKSGSSWIGQAALSEVPDSPLHVALEGDILAVGAPNASARGQVNAGVAQIWVRNNGTWALRDTFEGEAAGSFFGDGVAIAGNTIAIGGPGHGARGAVYVYERPSGSPNWQLANRITSDDVQRDTRTDLNDGASLGHSIAIKGDTMVVGAPGYGYDEDHQYLGAAFALKRNGATWTATRLGIGAVPGASLGWSAGLLPDKAVVGAPGERSLLPASPSRPGAAYVYQRSGTAWSKVQEVRPTDGQDGARFGESVALSSTALAIVSPLYQAVQPTDGTWTSNGQLYVYSSPAPRPPTVSCSGSQSLTSTSPDGVSATVSAQVADRDGGFLTVNWYVDGTNVKTDPISSADGTPISQTATLTQVLLPGSHTVRVSVTDGTFTGECSSTVNVNFPSLPGINIAPLVAFGDPVATFAPTSAGIPVTLSATVGDPNGNPLTVTWKVNGKNVQTVTVPGGTSPTSTQLNLTRTLAVGVHQIKIVVSDSQLSAEASTTATVMLNTTLSGQGVLTNLDGRISSRASQAGLDALTQLVRAINSSRLDTNVASRASQSSVDDLARKLNLLTESRFSAAVTGATQSGLMHANDNLGSLANYTTNALDYLTRLAIEQQLMLPGSVPLASFYLPASAGGSLDLVRQVASETVAGFKQLGFETKSSAEYLDQGEAAFSAGRYPLAYDRFRRAFQAITSDAKLNESVAPEPPNLISQPDSERENR